MSINLNNSEVNKNLKDEIAFVLLSKIISNSNDLHINQVYNLTPLRNPKSILEKNEISNRSFTKVTLIALEYQIQISQSITEDFLIFATPLEHLLSFNIILETKKKIFRIEYDFKTYLVLPEHLDYLGKPYTVLEEIEVEYLENFSYKTSFKQDIIFTLPQSSYRTHKIKIVEKIEHNKILFTPHINTLHLKYDYNEKLYLFDITSSKNFLQIIHGNIHFNTTIHKEHFLGAQVISTIQARYPLEIINDEQDLLIIRTFTEYYLQLNESCYIDIISSHPTDYPLPIYISSQYEIQDNFWINSYVKFEDTNHFLEKTGVHFVYDTKTLQELVVKEPHSKTTYFTNLYLKESIISLTSNPNLEIIIYSNALEFYLKKKFINSQRLEFNLHVEENKIQLFEEILSEYLSLVKNLLLKYALYPKSDSQDPISMSIAHCYSIIYNSLAHKHSIHQIIYIISNQIRFILNLQTIKPFTNENLSELFSIVALLYQTTSNSSNITVKNKEFVPFFESIKLDFSFFEDIEIFSNKEHFNNNSPQIFENNSKIKTNYDCMYQLVQVLNKLKNISFTFKTKNSHYSSLLNSQFPNAVEISSKKIDLKNKQPILSTDEFEVFF